MQTEQADLIVGGGGLVGTVLALALARLAPEGFRVALVDAEAPDRARMDARASALSAASKRLLTVLGIWERIEAEAEPIASIEVTDSPLSAALRPHLLGFEGDMLHAELRAEMIENETLRRALMDAAAMESAISFKAPDRIVDYAAGAGRVMAKLASGGAIEAALLIAADGKNSQLRERAGVKCVAWSYPQIGIVATVAHEKPHRGRAVQHFLPGGPFAILPLTRDRSSIVWTEEKPKGEAIMASGDEEFLAELSKRFGSWLGPIALAGPRQSFPLGMQIARSVVADRLALIGDAAHVVHPLAGQGLNIGFRDVAALSECVVEAARLGLDIGTQPVLERYQRWRRFDSAVSASVMDALNRLFSNDNFPLRAVRELGLGLVENAPWLKRALAREAAGFTGTVPRLLKGETP